MSRVDQYIISMSVNGERLGRFDAMTGGDVMGRGSQVSAWRPRPRGSFGGSAQNEQRCVVSSIQDKSRSPIVQTSEWRGRSFQSNGSQAAARHQWRYVWRTCGVSRDSHADYTTGAGQQHEFCCPD